MGTAPDFGSTNGYYVPGILNETENSTDCFDLEERSRRLEKRADLFSSIRQSSLEKRNGLEESCVD